MKNKNQKFIICLIVFLSIHSINLFGQNNISNPSTGEKQDTLISIPISTIREATIKLIERNEYKELNAQKDSIILEYKHYVKNQDNNITYLTKKVADWRNTCYEQEEIMKQLNKSLNKQKKVSNISASLAIGAGIVATIFILKK